MNDGERVGLRREEALPVLVEFKTWLDSRRGEVSPECLIGKAISYTLGQWEKLIRYIDYGFVPMTITWWRTPSVRS
jgi:hypothetical protein